jgi:hypothetical protein
VGGVVGKEEDEDSRKERRMRGIQLAYQAQPKTSGGRCAIGELPHPK